MICPARFISNPQTAGSNAFQNEEADTVQAQAQAHALQEFDAYVDALRDAGVGVTVIDDTPLPHTPDSIFPNNWISCHADGRVFLYPMEAPNRRQERRAAVLDKIRQAFHVREVIDFGYFEVDGHWPSTKIVTGGQYHSCFRRL
ncbi:arginine deiminase-related protein [Undibacterium sp. TJN19]|uniref:arginine deiminase-related protein n=1 Tax=Undibacterium sp. TJN19 TaxID=3413055 RepID=UPI003BF54B64